MAIEKQSKSRYLNLFSDRAFHRVFGCEQDKVITLSFLNSVLEESEQIIDFHFASTAYIANNPNERGVVIDLQCIAADGRRILVELQKRRQSHFQERSLYYATWPIQAQGKRGKWDYDMNAVYVISIMDFLIDKASTDVRVVTRKMILDTQTHAPWTDKLHFVCVEIPRFTKTLAQCETLLDKWFFVLKNLHRLMKKPNDWQEEIFGHLFEITDKARLQEQQLIEYEQSETEYNHMQNALDYAIKEGREEGVDLEKMETVKGMLIKGCDWAFIEEITHINQAGYDALRMKYKSPYCTNV